MNTSPDKSDRNLAADHELISRARDIYAQACANVDSRTHARLGAARRNALDAVHAPSRQRLWLPAAGAVAACALALGVVWLRPASAPSSAQNQRAALADAELPPDADPRQLDLYQNLDFYQWLAQQPNAHAPENGAPQ
ncbi:MAG TPA: hypothetical protein VN725_04970 [Rhodanobacteraceae bacterium]|nr:hypothetical protein [Rhodanobacteraceae bacterium]